MERRDEIMRRNNLKERRKEGKGINKYIKRRPKESNKIQSKKLIPERLEVLSFKQNVREQYRRSCKGNAVLYPPSRDNG